MPDEVVGLGRTARTRIRRGPDKAVSDPGPMYALLDRNFVCHLAYQAPHGPAVVPMVYGRAGSLLYLHGSTASTAMAPGRPICLAVTESTGIVMARAAFFHTMNYESAVVYGTAEPVHESEKLAGLRIISEHMIPGRWDDVRPPNAKELAATQLIKVPLDEAAMKRRSGPPTADPDDPDNKWAGTWTGVVPITTQLQDPLADEASASLTTPKYLER